MHSPTYRCSALKTDTQILVEQGGLEVEAVQGHCSAIGGEHIFNGAQSRVTCLRRLRGATSSVPVRFGPAKAHASFREHHACHQVLRKWSPSSKLRMPLLATLGFTPWCPLGRVDAKTHWISGKCGLALVVASDLRRTDPQRLYPAPLHLSRIFRIITRLVLEDHNITLYGKFFPNNPLLFESCLLLLPNSSPIIFIFLHSTRLFSNKPILQHSDSMYCLVPLGLLSL